MFSREGTARSDQQNRILAGYLAFVGGYVNSCGVVLIGAFTSHVTGNVGRVAQHASAHDYRAALIALSLVVAFFGGAFVVSVILESRVLGHVSRAYGLALAIESAVLMMFMATMGWSDPPVRLGAALLSFAMGLQNGLVTRLSGAVVRTTHLTGVITDLGIEAARWFRFGRLSLSEAARLRFVVGLNTPERPPVGKALLLGTVALSFFVGAIAGGFAAVQEDRKAIALPAIAVGLCSVYAIVRGRKHR